MNPPNDRAERFLAGVPPFHLLPDEVRREAAGRMWMEYFPRGEVFIRGGDTRLEHLYLIYRGAVRLYTRADRREILVDLRAEGDVIGAVALLENSVAAFHARAEEDVICFLIAKDVFLNLSDTYASFGDFFRSPLTGSASPRTRDINDVPEIGAPDFSTPLREVIRRPPVCCSPGETVGRAARLMSRARVGSIAVIDENRRLLGLVTDRELRRFVAGEGPTSGPVAGIMKTGPIAAHADDACLDALALMTRSGTTHLPVLDQGALIGVVTHHDLSRPSGAYLAAVFKDIETAPSEEVLARVRHGLHRTADSLIQQGLSVPGLQGVFTLIQDRLIQRWIELRLERLEREGYGPPPAAWAWMGLGAMGRKEQVLSGDPPFGIVHDNPLPENGPEVQRFFNRLAEGAGPESGPFHHSLNDWKALCRARPESSSPERLAAVACLDARPIYGRHDLARDVINQARKDMASDPDFPARLAAGLPARLPPLGFFRCFVLEKNGEHGPGLDLDICGLQPIVGSVRLLAMARGLPLTNTLDRLRALRESEALETDIALDTEEAYQYMFMRHLKHQIYIRTLDRSRANEIHPDLIDPAERRALKAAFRTVSRLMDRVSARFGPAASA